MKKIGLMMLTVFTVALFFTSCKETKKEEVKEEMIEESHEGHDHSNDTALVVYQCPMDCEKGKTYEVEGACPVCKMDLKELKAENDASEGL